MADANKRINLAAPLLSVRRHGGAGAEAAALPPCNCKPDATPGGVPFGWEHRPGHPKSVRTRRAPPPPTAPDEAPWDAKAVVVAAAPVPEEEERFSDALSRVDSCLTVNCSVTCLSDAGAAAEPGARGGVMMDRFLPAAQAVAVGSPQCTFRKVGGAAAAATGASAQEAARLAPANARTGDGDSLPRRLPVENSPGNHVPSNNAKDRNDDDEWDGHSARGFESKRCGLLPTRCVKSTLLLLNPAPAIRRHGAARRGRGKRFLSKGGRGQRATKPLVRRPRNGQQLGHDASLKSWEDVYINSLLRSGRGGRKGPGAMASELDRTARELYTDQGEGVHPKASHLGLLLVLDRGEQCAGNHGTSAQNFSDAGEPARLMPPRKSSLPAKANDGKKFRRDAGYDFPLLLEDKIVANRDMVPSSQPLLPLPPPPPNAPSESWLSRALPSVSNKPPPTSFLLGIRVQKRSPPPWRSSDQTKVIDQARPR